MSTNRVTKHALRLAVMATLGALITSVALSDERSGMGVATVAPITIPPGDLYDALKVLVRQTGVQVLYDSKAVEGVQTKGVKEAKSAQEAIQGLLDGTRFTTSMDRSGAILISVAGRDSKESVGKSDRVSDGREGSSEAWKVAENANTPSQSSEGAGSGSGTENKLEEVVVTAQKRKERVQDVPISISVVTAADIDRRGMVSGEDYLRSIPGVSQVTQGLYGQNIVIRGIDNGSSGNAVNGAATAIYFGETATTSSGGLSGGSNVDIKLVDIERVEVLRGPQGTAFGSSALAGAVREIPVAPKLDRLEGKVAAGYSYTDGFGGSNSDLQGVINFPLVRDKLAVRAVGYRFEDTGYYRNVAGSDPAFQASLVDDHSPLFGAQAYASDDKHAGTSRFLGGRLAALYQATDALQITVSYLKQKTESDGILVETSGPYEQTVLQVAPEDYRRHGQTGGIYDTDIDLTNATLTYDFGKANLLATYSYVKSGTTGVWPFTGINLASPLSFGSPSEQHARSGEVRLTTKLDGAWNFLGGVYAENINDNYDFDYFWAASATSNQLCVSDPSCDPYWGGGHQEAHLKQKAAFAEASWKFLPQFTLTGGARFYDYKRTSLLDTNGVIYSGGSELQTDMSDSGTNFRGTLSYKPSDKALVYAGWAQGFRLGLSGGGLPPCADANHDGLVDGTNTTLDSTRIIKSDHVDNYELGTKVALLGGRVGVDADVFRINWIDIPVIVAAPQVQANCTNAWTANAGAARSDGIELQTHLYATPAFRIDVGGSWIRARLTKDAPAINAFKGNRLPAPEFNAQLGLQYNFTLSGIPAFVRLDQMYVGPFFADVQETPIARTGGYMKLDASARVALRGFDVDLFIRNLTNEDNYTYRGGVVNSQFAGYRMRPRTVGLQLSHDFGVPK